MFDKAKHPVLGDLATRYRAAREAQKDDAQLQRDLLFAAGVLLGGDMPGGAAAIETSFRRLFPDTEYPVMA